jgi:hypothetical protein
MEVETMNMDTDKKMLLCLAGLYVIGLAAGLMINRALRFDTIPAYVAGLTVGAALTAVRIITLKRSIDRLSIQSSGETAGGAFSNVSFVIQYMLRSAASAAALLIAVLNPFLSVWGVAAGLLMMQFAAYGARLWPQKEASRGL